MDAGGKGPEWVQTLLAAVDAFPEKRFKDADLRSMNIEPARARRYFQDRFGMTFHAYSRARRLGNAFTQIKAGEGLDDVIFQSGYESHSGFRTAYTRTFGSAPKQSSKADCIVTAWIETPLGPMVGGATNKGVCLLEFTDRRMLETQLDILHQRFACAIVPGERPVLESLRTELGRYFEGKLTKFTVPLDTRGTPFQERVWAALLQIPFGQTRSYEQMAAAIGNPAAIRAAAHANGCNRIAILVPCHRVVNKDGQLGGYGGGLWRKRKLLDLEQQQLSLLQTA
jgi:AraC family transcriptional regulator of adaptative response/methylated-DNA-[protein]-cysteine methyltransferase